MDENHFRRVLHVKCYCEEGNCKINIAGEIFRDLSLGVCLVGGSGC